MNPNTASLSLAYERAAGAGRTLNAVVALFSPPAPVPAGPLHNLPVAVKDIIDIAGHPRGNGNPEAMKGQQARTDAPVVAALREAGAVVFAATAMLEYAAGATHPLIPETLNPYSLTRTAGGSSGGSAALVGIGACPVALGTDTGGSIRIPAHYCAAVGFKPSYGALPTDGVEPLSPTLDHVGLLSDTVSTARRVFSALTGLECSDPLPAHPLRVGVITSWLKAVELERDVADAVTLAVETLRAAGCEIIEVDGSIFSKLQPLFDDILLYEAWQVHGHRIRADPEHYGAETLRMLRGAATVSREQYDAAMAERQAILPDSEHLYGEIDVLLTPAAPFVAPATTPPSDTAKGAAEGMFTSVFNLTGDPALVLPCGWSRDGLPIGIQLVGPIGSDAALLTIAARIEALLAVPRRSPIIP